MSESIRNYLDLVTTLKMGVRIAIIIAIVTAVSYWHINAALQDHLLGQIEKYIVERGQRESNLFSVAESHTANFKSEFLKRLKKLGDRDVSERLAPAACQSLLSHTTTEPDLPVTHTSVA